MLEITTEDFENTITPSPKRSPVVLVDMQKQQPSLPGIKEASENLNDTNKSHLKLAVFTPQESTKRRNNSQSVDILKSFRLLNNRKRQKMPSSKTFLNKNDSFVELMKPHIAKSKEK